MPLSTAQDIVQVFEQAKNTNSAVKKFLKNEVGGDAKSEKFAKSFREAFASGSSKTREEFVEDHLANFEPHLLVLARIAHTEIVAKIAEEIYLKYAESFNATYVIQNDEVQFQDEGKFKQIVSDVSALVESSLAQVKAPGAPFMKKVVFFFIFETPVLKKVLPLAGMQAW